MHGLSKVPLEVWQDQVKLKMSIPHSNRKVLNVHTKGMCKNVRSTSDYRSQQLETKYPSTGKWINCGIVIQWDVVLSVKMN